MPDMPIHSAASRTFVLVHGGFHGGWCWSQVAALLRARGHAVFTPTQTGCGERCHLLTRSITLDTFIDDIANVLRWEDLHNVVLVGHSFGGIAITGVADRMSQNQSQNLPHNQPHNQPQRLRQLIYLDSLILQNGQCAFDLLEPSVVQTRLQAAQANGGVWIEPPPPSFFGVFEPEQMAFLQGRLTPHPLGTYTSPLKLQHQIGRAHV